MKERQKRLIEAYEHLREHYGVHTKSQFAEVLGYGRTSLSSALNGNEDYITDKLFKTICDAYRGVFNLDYLLTGNGCLLTTEEEVSSDRIKKQAEIESKAERCDYVDALIAAKNETIASLHRELDAKNELINMLQSELHDLRFKVYRKERRNSDDLILASEPDAPTY
jgi:hypothetical protein